MTVALGKKTGRIPKGTYAFLEYYCVEPGCDCRRVTLLVMNETMKQKAAISFGFDQQGPFAGPYLDTANRQSPYAEDLLQLFVDRLNAEPDWLERLYRHYRAVREKVEEKPYRGKPFPKPASIAYRATPPPDLAAEIEQSIRNLRREGGAPETKAKAGAPAGPGPAGKSEAAPPPAAEQDITGFLARYVEAGTVGPAGILMELHDDLRRYLLEQEGAGEELAGLLPSLYQRSPQPDEQIQAALRLLFDSLDLLDQAIEDGGRDAKKRMALLQEGLARHVFTENEDPDLRAAVLNIVVQSRVDTLPVLRDASITVVDDYLARTDLHDATAEEALAGISRSFHSLGVASPFEGADELLQLLLVDEADMQTALVAEMLEAADAMLREIGALMLFHHEPKVRSAVASILAAADGKTITPDTLRRLIVSRNWFPESMRKPVDQAITNARKSRVECAALPRLPSITVYATFADGSGAQSFQVIVPDGGGHARCSILLDQQEGVLHCFVTALESKYQLDDFLRTIKKDPAHLESSAEHLDLRVCNALADGARAGNVPNQWLVRVAELLGRDRWRPIAFDAARELLMMQEDLAAHDPKLLDEQEYRNALLHSDTFADSASFFGSWYEDAEVVDPALKAVRGTGQPVNSGAAAERIADDVLEQRRTVWLERLVVAALWLKSAKKAPVPWHKVYHVAQAVADESVPLKEIPLMLAIAKESIRASSARNAKGAKGRGGR